MEDFESYSQQERALVESHLQEEPSFLMRIIRAHFLFEQKLNEMMRLLVRNPSVLEASNAPRIDFHTKLHFAKALAPKPPNEWFWPALSKVNSIRNKAAHGLESEKLNTAIQDFVDHMKNNSEVHRKNMAAMGQVDLEDECVYAITSAFAFHTIYVQKIREHIKANNQWLQPTAKAAAEHGVISKKGASSE